YSSSSSIRTPLRIDYVEFLLEQMRLCVARKDFIRQSILSKKISVRFFDDKSDEVQELKLKYCDLMIKLGLNDSAYLDVYRLYRNIFDTPRIQADAARSIQVLKCMALYVLLAPHTNEQSDLLHRVYEMRQLQLVPDYNVLLNLFVEEEIIFWKDKVVAQFEELLRRGTKTSPPTDVFDITESGNKRWSDLQSRVAEHVWLRTILVLFLLLFLLLNSPISEEGAVDEVMLGIRSDMFVHLWREQTVDKLSSIKFSYSLLATSYIELMKMLVLSHFLSHG
uniref:PCI domain-containing protein n=2 Tax=Parascaris univalens TaxID=6257 RepID=A0A915A2B3_PARUN